MARWKYTFSAVDPANVSGFWQIGIAEARMRLICNQGHDKSHARVVLVGEVAEDPIALYRGWNRLGRHQDCFVYVGQPKHDYHKLSPEICVPAPPEMVFVLFVLSDGTIDDWTWRRHAEGNVLLPLGVECELLWQKTST